MHRLLIVTALAVSIGLASPAVGAENPESSLELTNISPGPIETRLTEETVLSASLKYSIDLPKLKRKKYFVSIIFGSTEGDDSWFNEERTRLGTDRVYLTEPEGAVTLEYPLDAVWNDKRLKHPITVRFVLLERSGSRSSRSVAIVDPVIFE